VKTLHGEGLAQEFIAMMEEYVVSHYRTDDSAVCATGVRQP
jgi:hypothetical protein